MKLTANFFGGVGDVLKVGAEGAAWVASWGAVDAARARLDRAVEVEERRRRDLAALLNHFDERVGRSFKAFDAAVRAAINRADAARRDADAIDQFLPAAFDPVEHGPVERFRSAVDELWSAERALEDAGHEIEQARAGLQRAEEERERLRASFRDSLSRGYEAARNAFGGVAEIAKLAHDEANALARQRAYFAKLPGGGAEA